MKSKKTSDELEELRLKEKYLEAISSFTAALFEAQTVDEIMRTATQNAVSKLGYFDCVIYLYDKEKNLLVQSAAYGPQNPKKGSNYTPVDIKPGTGIVGYVFKSGQGEIIADTSKDPRYIIDDEARYSEMAVPMYYKNAPIGVIDSEHPEKNFFTTNDLQTLITVAQLVSAKIAQAWVTEELISYQENLEQIINEKTKELEEKNTLLTAQNKEKELLIREIHHRVKNNMQIMASLANLQLHATTDNNVKYSLKQFSSRINSMAIIHEQLYQNTEMSSITIDFYLVDLLKNIIHSFSMGENVKLILDLEPLHIDLDAAIPLGLLINELTTNSLKHAFEAQQEPEIKITVKENKGQAVLDFQDNGKGIMDGEDNPESFGMELISVLSEQIGYDITLENNRGFHFSLKFDL